MQPAPRPTKVCPACDGAGRTWAPSADGGHSYPFDCLTCFTTGRIPRAADDAAMTTVESTDNERN